MSRLDEQLDAIFADDPLELLEVKPKIAARTEDERLVASFEEINSFVTDHGREPERGTIQETMLFFRLKSLREDAQKRQVLGEYDRHGLLSDELEATEVASLEDILEGDSLGILDSDAERIFTLKHVPKDIASPDYVAQRKPCKDFEQFAPLFKACQADLAAGRRDLLEFRNGQQIHEGLFFVLKGVLLYVAKVGEFESTKDGRLNARLHCVFENGTESDMLLRSLSAELYKNGKRVSENKDKLLGRFKDVTDEDEEAGFIYVLKSRSTDPAISDIDDLYKIGYSQGDVAERVKHAHLEPTFLMAPVSIVTAFKCYNLNPQRLESLLHRFFGVACLNLDVFDAEGKRHTPREWFVAPLDVIEKAVSLLISGEILKYEYDVDAAMIVGRT